MTLETSLLHSYWYLPVTLKPPIVVPNLQLYKTNVRHGKQQLYTLSSNISCGAELSHLRGRSYEGIEALEDREDSGSTLQRVHQESCLI